MQPPPTDITCTLTLPQSSRHSGRAKAAHAPPGGAADDVRADHQPQGLQGPRPDNFLDHPLPSRFSIVTDSRGNPVCVVETIGEWDRTLENCRAHCWEFNAPRWRALGKAPTPEVSLVCERFSVVYP